MDDVISRRDVIECLEHLSACDEPFMEIGTNDETFIGKYEAITKISDLPSAQPQRAGHWIFIHPLQENDSGAYICSECGTGDWDINPVKDKVCKFCGARMEDNNESD